MIDYTAESPFGLAEVKCPYSKFQVTPMAACDDRVFCCIVENGHVKLKQNHAYYSQVQGQMGVTGAKWVDFIIYTNVGLSVERIDFDPKHWEAMSEKLTSFYAKYFVQEAVKK